MRLEVFLPKRNAPEPEGTGEVSFSLIRTITVGSGLSPDLLTSTNRALAGSPHSVYRRWEFRPALRIKNNLAKRLSHTARQPKYVTAEKASGKVTCVCLFDLCAAPIGLWS